MTLSFIALYLYEDGSLLNKKFWVSDPKYLHRFRKNQDKIFMTHLTFHALDIHRFWLCKLLGYRGPVSMGSTGSTNFLEKGSRTHQFSK